jgi:hypothetical protein
MPIIEEVEGSDEVGDNVEGDEKNIEKEEFD